MQNLGDRIRELRNERDLSLRELAKLVEVSAPFLSDVEQGRRFPKDDTLDKLARALRTTVASLKTYDTRPPSKEMGELADIDVGYAVAFRRMVEHVREQKLTPEEIIQLLEPGKTHKPKSSD